MNTRLVLLLVVTAFFLGCTGRSRAERQALEQLRQLATLMGSFSLIELRYPHSFEELLAATGADRSLLYSPLSTDRNTPSYELLLPGKRLSEIRNPSQTILIRSRFTTKNGVRLAIFADGHIERIPDGEVPQPVPDFPLAPKPSKP